MASFTRIAPARIAAGVVALACLALAAQASAQLSFQSDLWVDGPDRPAALELGDFDEEGVPDVVTSNTNATAALMLGRGDGWFDLQTPVSVGGNNQNLVTGDFDGDTHLDAAIASFTTDDVNVLLGDGTGALSASGSYGTGSQPFDVAKGHLDGDADLDLVTANQNANSVSVLIGDGSGAFSPASPAAYGVGALPRGLEVGDVTGDGEADVVVANTNADTLSILVGHGDGTFTVSPTTYATTDGPRKVALGDYDEDGSLDIATADSGDGVPPATNDRTTVLLNDGSGTFSAASGSPFTTGPAGSSPFAISAKDVDGDGHLDLVTANRFGNSLSVLLGDGDGGFAAPVFAPYSDTTDAVITDVAVGDVNDDDRPDLIGNLLATPGYLVVFRNSTTIDPPIVSATTPSSPGSTGSPTVSGTADGDTVSLYETSDCSGLPAATGTAAEFEGPGITVSVPPDETRTFHATTANAAGWATSACSATSVEYTYDATPTTFFVTEGGTDTGDCTVDPCATVQYAIDRHRQSPNPGDLIDVGPGDFDGNVEATEPGDQGLRIRGAVAGGAPATSLHGTGDGAEIGGGPTGTAVLLGGCGASEVKLRDVNVDTAAANPDVMALELDGGSDLRNVTATNQPGSTAYGVVFVCGGGTLIKESEIVASSDEVAITAFEGLRFLESSAISETGTSPALFGVPGSRPAVQLRVRRSRLSLPADGSAPTVFSGARLVADSSLITGGVEGVELGQPGASLINNSTIDAGDPGVSDPTGTPSLVVAPFYNAAHVAIESSILVDGLQAPAGRGSAICADSDLPATEQGGRFVIDCPTGPGTTNTTTDPADLFAGGAPYDWALATDSPAIDTGGPGDAPSGVAVRDLAGNPRRAAGSAATCPQGIRDKGAYEFVGPPCELAPPTLLDADDPAPGRRLRSSRGEFSNEPTTYTRLWLRCDSSGDDCNAITPQPHVSGGYTVRSADIGHTLRVQVIAGNAAGDSGPAVSAASGVVVSGS